MEVGGVVLAAGTSSRFEGGNKLAVELDGEPIVRRATRCLLRSRLEEVVVIVGFEADRIAALVEDLPVAVRRNERFSEGQSTSVRTGVDHAVDRGWSAAVFGLGDMPFVDPTTVDSLIEAHENSEGSILWPSFEGERGNPVLFSGEHFDALRSVTGDRGGRRLVETHPGSTPVPVDDPGVIRDVDRETDLD
ncbi:molybdenum cofactor cytidylyltransferase [Halalkaliarchaeum desulfuricum]|uniref:Molybdenum cofactor cytidylyltransferase n=1 Tax=Halalkaliarchaeum desulfuricum TaxID=2055893 RepID=A0A343TLY9_9EURY|nr:molybdenum cofactor cytidylyltransferase [Halalkaliarchaeum desulfuricum]